MKNVWLTIGILIITFVFGFVAFIPIYSPTNSINSEYSVGSWDNDTELYSAVVSSMNDNQIQAARDLVSLTNESNDIYDAIRDNKIQKARNIIRYLNK